MAMSAAEPQSPAMRWPIILAVVLTAVLEVLDSTIVNVALPHMKAAFGVTTDQTIWIVTSYIVASVVVMPLTGFFVRLVGRRRLITTAILGFMAFSALCGLSGSIEMMVAFRLGQGMFGAFLIPLSQAILFDSFPKERRGEAMALFGLGVVVAPVLGPTIGAILTNYFSWRAVFYVNLPIAAFALIMMSGELKKEETRSVRVDWTGLIFMALAIGGLQLMLDQGQSRGWFASPLIQAAGFVALAAGLLFVIRGIGLKTNILDFSLFRDRSFAAANVAMMGFGLAMYGSIAVLPLFVQSLLGYPVLASGYLFIPRGLAGGVSMVLTGAVLIRFVDPRALLAAGLLLTGLGNLLMTYTSLASSFWELAWPGILAGLGMGMFFVPISTLAFQNIGPDKQDEASGIYGVTRSLGSSVGIAVVGWTVANRVQFHWSVLTAGLTPYNENVTSYLGHLGVPPQTAAGAAQLSAQVARQASLLAYQDVFWMTGWVAFAMIPFIFLMQRPPKRAHNPAPAH